MEMLCLAAPKGWFYRPSEEWPEKQQLLNLLRCSNSCPFITESAILMTSGRNLNNDLVHDMRWFANVDVMHTGSGLVMKDVDHVARSCHTLPIVTRYEDSLDCMPFHTFIRSVALMRHVGTWATFKVVDIYREPMLYPRIDGVYRLPSAVVGRTESLKLIAWNMEHAPRLGIWEYNKIYLWWTDDSHQPDPKNPRSSIRPLCITPTFKGLDTYPVDEDHPINNIPTLSYENPFCIRGEPYQREPDVYNNIGAHLHVE